MINTNLTGFIKKKKTKSNFVVDIMKLINLFLKKGLKSKALNVLLDSLVFLKIKLNNSPLNYFYNILKKIKPLVELKNLKIGSSKYLIPTPLTLSRQLFLGLNILIKNAKLRPERNVLAFKFANEILDFSNKRGETYKQFINFFNLVNDNIQNSKFSKFNNLIK